MLVFIQLSLLIYPVTPSWVLRQSVLGQCWEEWRVTHWLTLLVDSIGLHGALLLAVGLSLNTVHCVWNLLLSTLVTLNCIQPSVRRSTCNRWGGGHQRSHRHWKSVLCKKIRQGSGHKKNLVVATRSVNNKHDTGNYAHRQWKRQYITLHHRVTPRNWDCVRNCHQHYYTLFCMSSCHYWYLLFNWEQRWTAVI